VETSYFQRPEGTLAYSDPGGEGDLVLMLPGLGALRNEYRYLVPPLRDAGYRAVAVDLRGHGASSVPWDTYDVPAVGGDLLALIDHLDAGPAHLIGTSFAGAAVVWAAAERPQAVRSLTLINAFARATGVSLLMRALTWLMMHHPWRVRTWVAYYRTLYPTRKPGDFDAYLAALRANMAEPGRFDAAVGMTFSSRQPSDERLEQVEDPVLVIMGAQDGDFPDPAAEGRALAQRTGGRLELIDGAGHYPQTEMPDQTAAVILDFLQQA
jgi:pimeloyl-ACP methyl ester carboxylesterase